MAAAEAPSKIGDRRVAPAAPVTGYRVAARGVRHAVLALAAALLAGGTAQAAHAAGRDNRVFLASFALGWAALAFLGATLLTGVWSVLRGGPDRAGRVPGPLPVSTMLRRDLGIWSGLLGLAHVAFGLQVHLRGQMIRYFFYGGGFEPRRDVFGVANWTGLAATGILVLLLALSNDRSLRLLGAARWKSLQRGSYAAAALVAVHGVAYQVTEKRALPWVVALAGMVTAVAALQLLGARRFRARRAPLAVTPRPTPPRVG